MTHMAWTTAPGVPPHIKQRLGIKSEIYNHTDVPWIYGRRDDLDHQWSRLGRLVTARDCGTPGIPALIWRPQWRGICDGGPDAAHYPGDPWGLIESHAVSRRAMVTGPAVLPCEQRPHIVPFKLAIDYHNAEIFSHKPWRPKGFVNLRSS